MVKTRVGSPSLHAAACANSGQRDEDECSHEHRITPPLLTLLVTSWLQLKAPPCKYSSVHSALLLIILFFLTCETYYWPVEVFFFSSFIWSAFPLVLSRFEVGFSLGCEVMFMKVCAEGRKTASTDWMPPSIFTMPLRDVPPLTPEWDPWQQCRPLVCRFIVYSYYCRFHPGDFSGPLRRDLTLILTTCCVWFIYVDLKNKKKTNVICTTEPHAEF